MIWGLASSQLNLTNSLLTLGEGMVKSQGIYVDGGTASLDNVRISGNSGGSALSVRYGGTLYANNLNILINNANNLDNDYATAINISRGSSNNIVTLENSRVEINGSSAIGIQGDIGAIQTANLNNSQVLTDNVVAKVDGSAALQLNTDASVLSGKTLIQGGTANAANSIAAWIRLDATHGSQLSGDADIDHAWTNDSRLTLDNASAWQGASRGLHQLVLSNGSQWNMTADSDVGSVDLADSQVRFDHADGSFKTLTVDGDYHSNNGTLVMNSMLNSDSSSHDTLIIKGNATGTTQVVVNKAGGSGAQTLQGIELISVAGDSSAEFKQQGRIVAGAYDYFLQRGTDTAAKNWYLTSSLTPVTIDPILPVDPTEPGDPIDPVLPVDPVIRPVLPLKPAEMIVRPEVGSYNANMLAANTLFNLRLHDRGGETQYLDARTGEQKVTSMWMRNVGGHQQTRDGNGQLKTETNRYVLQLGGDIGQWTTNGSDSLHFGAMAGYGNAQSRTDSALTGFRSKGQTNGYSVGLYGTWYQQPEARSGAYVDSWAQYSWFNNSVSGEMSSSESYKSKGMTASVEGGYRWKLGEDSHKNGYFIEPNAQLIAMGVKADDLTESNGTRVSSEGSGNIQSRLGMRASLETSAQGLTPWLEANWIANSKAFGSTLNGVTLENQGSKNVAEVRVGVDSRVQSNLNLWGNVGQQMGSESYRDTSAMVGVKLSF